MNGIGFTLSFVFLAMQAAAPLITYPAAGQYLQGQVVITGTTDVPGFASAQLDFAYALDSTETWFPMHVYSAPVVDSPLAAWDTAAITDGSYVLRLRVILQDGSSRDAIVQIEVFNDAPLPSEAPAATSTPQPVVEIPSPILLGPSPTPTASPIPTPTRLSQNPAGLTQGDIYLSLRWGAVLVVVVFSAFGLLARLRRD